MWTRSSRRLLSGTASGKLVLWDVLSGTPTFTQHNGSVVYSLLEDLVFCNDFLDSRDCKQVPYVHARFLFARGSLVSTPFGQGRVLDFRHHDGVYEVGLSGWGAHVFILGRKISWAFRGAPGDLKQARPGGRRVRNVLQANGRPRGRSPRALGSVSCVVATTE